ncbi:MAG: hypothetical protein LBC44_02765, partial [Mycoplasmataceae bacterium]|nr:hypothetical protein [Mycoplasmataceae bacterium]
MSFNIAASVFAGAGIIAFTAWLTQCKPEMIIPGIPQIKRETNTIDGILCRPDDNVKLTVEGVGNKLIEWKYEPNDNIDFHVDNSDNSLTVSVKSNVILTQPETITIDAIYEEEVLGTTVLIIGTEEPLDVPIEDTSIFKFRDTDGLGINDTIIGFADEVIWNPLILSNHYNALDFSKSSDVKYISGDCVFNPVTPFSYEDDEGNVTHKKLFDIWKPFEINFGSLTFLHDENGNSGNGLFKDADLNSLIKLDFGTSNWATPGTTSSAKEIFANANLSGLAELKISKATFAGSEMGVGIETIDTGHGIANPDIPIQPPRIRTLSETFEQAQLNTLVSLDLSEMNFADKNMTTKECDISTGYHTFNNAHFDNLTSLNLSNTVFAKSEMSEGGKLYTGNMTFGNIEFSELDDIKLDGTLFSSANMSTSCETNTA